ncbi:methyltransferase domain-containing protein [Streptomyces nigra]
MGRAEALPLADDDFDVAVCSLVLCTVANCRVPWPKPSRS